MSLSRARFKLIDRYSALLVAEPLTEEIFCTRQRLCGTARAPHTDARRRDGAAVGAVDARANDELLSTILFLINNHYWCALYELYVDARRLNVLDSDLPSLNTLKSFFNDSKRFPDGVFRAVSDAFDSGVSAARVVDAESRAAVAEYELRCAREDLQNSRRGAGGGGGADGGDDASGASVRRGVDADEAFAPTSGDSARSSADDVGLDAKLDAATYEYLSRRGYKATALSMRDESSTAAKLMEKDFASDGERSFGALRRMYERARMTETTASALESERARVDDVESELIRAPRANR